MAPHSSDASTRRGRYDRSISTQQRHAHQKAELVRAAADQLAAEGYRDITVERTLSRTVISRATFYLHFDDIDQLVQAVEERARVLLIEPCVAASGLAVTPQARLRDLISAWLEATRELPALTRAVLLNRDASGRLAPRLTLALIAAVGPVLRAAHRDRAVSHAPTRLHLQLAADVLAAVALEGINDAAPTAELEALAFDLILRLLR